jgi:hypothetical protein
LFQTSAKGGFSQEEHGIRVSENRTLRRMFRQERPNKVKMEITV